MGLSFTSQLARDIEPRGRISVSYRTRAEELEFAGSTWQTKDGKAPHVAYRYGYRPVPVVDRQAPFTKETVRGAWPGGRGIVDDNSWQRYLYSKGTGKEKNMFVDHVADWRSPGKDDDFSFYHQQRPATKKKAPDKPLTEGADLRVGDRWRKYATLSSHVANICPAGQPRGENTPRRRSNRPSTSHRPDSAPPALHHASKVRVTTSGIHGVTVPASQLQLREAVPHTYPYAVAGLNPQGRSGHASRG
mmetsp:Transcript_2306/g.3888  ORF Transcript_2306/g.3888 Transcript_2306/m.3888 type:complete len:247 (+) Transcript_2306:428-1168(+)|eukprot:CAMPEP_0198201098 /NCGR_PEP_ID=MMETSP1445-20131203/3902_1 /TAXON_ID=36898 /ORGANISM="Pyramimonas sp., Strain CCMP2087" /LENGTH=246 /DNA_ID=CAMNT_0043871291 /DNA_START=439 /DNA_END=1179 /DNA_ORIENTATION=+